MKFSTRKRFVCTPILAILFCGNVKAQQSDFYATWRPFDQYISGFSQEEINNKMSQLKGEAKEKYIRECQNAKENADSFYFAGIRAKNIETFAISKQQLVIKYYKESEDDRRKRLRKVWEADFDLTREEAEKKVDAEVHVPGNLAVRNCPMAYLDPNLFQAWCLGSPGPRNAPQPFFFKLPKNDQLVIRIRRTRDSKDDVFIAMKKSVE